MAATRGICCRRQAGPNRSSRRVQNLGKFWGPEEAILLFGRDGPAGKLESGKKIVDGNAVAILHCEFFFVSKF